MKRLFNTNFNHESLHFMLLILRICIASLMIVHGYQKVRLWPLQQAVKSSLLTR